MKFRRYNDATRKRACDLRRAGKTLREVAETMHMTKSTTQYLTRGVSPVGPERGRRIKPWKDEWTALLGTDTDRAVAVKIGVSTATVVAHRLAANIRCHDLPASHAAKLVTVPDADLAGRTAHDLAHEYDVPISAVGSARNRRGVRFRQPPDTTAALRRAAVAGMLAACEALGGANHDGTQSRIADVLGVSRERARQLCDEVRTMWRDAP